MSWGTRAHGVLEFLDPKMGKVPKRNPHLLYLGLLNPQKDVTCGSVGTLTLLHTQISQMGI
jgi:hypothetical protein